jgi:cation:H+ antiporter
MISSLFLFAGGVMLLVKGASWLVDGAASVARRLGVAPIVIGLTVVAFGTSMPELVVNLVASFEGKPGLAISNVLGSNIANILLILGVTAALYPIAIKRNTVGKEVPMAFAAIALVWLLANDRLVTGGATDALGRGDGVILLACFAAFLWYTASISRDGGASDGIATYSAKMSAVYVVAGLLGLVVGGKLCVDGAVGVARVLGLSERAIGLTVVAIGTSLPELVTSAVAAYRRHADIAIGNVLGSNILNVFLILGLSATIRPLPFAAESSLDVIVAGSATLVLLMAAFVGKRLVIERWQGVVFIGLYVGYLVAVLGG